MVSSKAGCHTKPQRTAPTTHPRAIVAVRLRYIVRPQISASDLDLRTHRICDVNIFGSLRLSELATNPISHVHLCSRLCDWKEQDFCLKARPRASRLTGPPCAGVAEKGRLEAGTVVSSLAFCKPDFTTLEREVDMVLPDGPSSTRTFQIGSAEWPPRAKLAKACNTFNCDIIQALRAA